MVGPTVVIEDAVAVAAERAVAIEIAAVVAMVRTISYRRNLLTARR